MAVSAEIQREILATFEARRGLYDDYCRTLGGLIESVLAPRGIQTHSVSFRAKEFDSLAEKVTRPDKSYSRLDEITDLAGVRITTYFADDVDRVAEALRTEFLIDSEASVDKRQYVDPDRFGYRSLHYVVSLGPNREALSEYSRFTALKCEIQVRSILQHAWAEIEHDLGYKSAAGVPAELRRKFARIASLLELADDEFSSIRTALAQYEQSVPEKIRSAPQTVDLDLPSFKALYTLPSAVTSLDDAVREAGKIKINSKLRRADSFVERLHSFGVTTVDALEKTARSERDTVRALARSWLGASKDTELTADAGIGVFYLLYVLAWKTKDRERIMQYLTANSIGSRDTRDALADRLLAFDPEAHAS
jgi:putative GTP pyrophosphokinase